ncbi:hypothetical protein FQR65_LT01822 [Abscondita terminalis]|nr:hypothetical protein FQR65_LT01822 [Abscondita terminalis]
MDKPKFKSAAARYRPTERPLPTKPQDNLKPNFKRLDIDERNILLLKYLGERPEQEKFHRLDTIKYETAGRPQQVRPEDNVHPEDDFERHHKTKSVLGDRPKPKHPEDYLRPEEDFERPTSTKMGPDERRN